MALTVGASNDINQLTEYTSSGFLNPGSTPGQEEDYKPDILAPGGSDYYSNIMSVDSNDADGENTSLPMFRAMTTTILWVLQWLRHLPPAAASLVVDALQSTGNLTGDIMEFFTAVTDVRLVKMLLCATATETNANREAGTGSNPTLQRALQADLTDSLPARTDLKVTECLMWMLLLREELLFIQ